MSVAEFNNLLKLYRNDTDAANRLNLYCLKVIKKRLLFRNGLKDLESIAHSILLKFITKLPDYVLFPVAYLNKCTDNHLSTLKSKREREIALTSDISYEQSFEELDKFDIISELEQYLDKLDVDLIYGYCVEDIPEKVLAVKYNISYEAARQRISRSKKKLRTIFGKDVTMSDKE